MNNEEKIIEMKNDIKQIKNDINEIKNAINDTNKHLFYYCISGALWANAINTLMDTIIKILTK